MTSRIWRRGGDLFAVESAIFVKQRSIFLLFRLTRRGRLVRPLSRKEGKLCYAVQSSVSLLISYIGVRAYRIWNWCVNRRTHVNDVRISGGYEIDARLRLSYMGEPELSLSYTPLVILIYPKKREREGDKERQSVIIRSVCSAPYKRYITPRGLYRA